MTECPFLFKESAFELKESELELGFNRLHVKER